jgi:hypothetical protein
MDELSVPLLSQMISTDFARVSGCPLSDETLRDLAVRIETGIRTALNHQREALVAQCEARCELWTRTEQGAGVPGNLRAEARARANEAAYLRDALRSSS